EGALKHSYPDWVEEVWTRDFGREQALALMRAQNEAPETVVRLIRGEIAGEPPDIPGADRVERVDEHASALARRGRLLPANSRASGPPAPARFLLKDTAKTRSPRAGCGHRAGALSSPAS